MYTNPNETYISIDVETNGNVPGINSMYSLGAVAFDYRGKELSSWYLHLAEVPGTRPNKETMEWWKQFPKEFDEASRCAYEMEPDKFNRVVMLAFVSWVDNMLPGKKVIMANPGMWDGMWVYWYCIKYVGRSPFGHRALDMRTATMHLFGDGFMNNDKNLLKKIFKDIKNPMDHHALHDAREQGQQYFALLKYAKNLDK